VRIGKRSWIIEAQELGKQEAAQRRRGLQSAGDLVPPLESINLATQLEVGTATNAKQVESALHRAQIDGAMTKKPLVTRKAHAETVLPGAMICGEVTSATVGKAVVVRIHGTGGPLTALTAQKGPTQIRLPPATITGVSPNSKYVAWDGNVYVFRPTLESVLADDSLMLIGRVNELTADGDSALTMGKDRVAKTATPHQKGTSKGRPRSTIVATRQEVLRKSASTGLTGARYCEDVVRRGLSTSVEWQKSGCPKS
jgi:hypothetical protein